MVKKIFATAATILAFLALPATTFAATLTLNPASGTFNRGCNVSLKIDLDTTGTNTDGTDVILNYDPAKFTISTSSITNGTIYADYPGNSVDPALGKISISGISSVSSPYNGKGTFATLNIKVADNAPAGTSQIAFDFDPNDKTNTTDSNVVERGTIADVLSAVTDGAYTIGTGSCVGGGQGQVQTGTGLTGTPSATKTPVITNQLPNSGLTDTTTLIAIFGTILTIIGIAGLALL